MSLGSRTPRLSDSACPLQVTCQTMSASSERIVQLGSRAVSISFEAVFLGVALLQSWWRTAARCTNFFLTPVRPRTGCGEAPQPDPVFY